MEPLVNDLIKYFLNEASHPIIDIPENYVNKREFLRGLINVREAKLLPNEIIEKENELLRQELEKKELVDINSYEDRFSLYQGDITIVKCDGIINPTNKTMLGCSKPNHNCISNKVHSYAGISLRLKCKEITKGQEIETCKVILTEGYNLPCDYIIHVVKPEVEILDEEMKELIRNFYINSLEMASKNNIKTLCIPNLKIPSEYKEEVSKIIISTIKDYLKENEVLEKVLFNVYTLEDFDIYNKYF